MPIREIRDHCYADWKGYEGAYDAFVAEIAAGLSIIECGRDITATIREEKAAACRAFRVRFEYFDKLSAATD